jgi:diaminopimelate epimerase
LTFSKWEGLGNDFVVLDAREGLPPHPSQLALAVCDRHYGIGADGLALITLAAGPGDFGMEIYNGDGSHAQMCGNALRCLAACATRAGWGAPPGSWMQIATASGIRRARVLRQDPWWVEIDMGQPGPVEERALDPHRAFFTSMGNPHCVIPVEVFGDWQQQGATLEKAHQANVEFVKIGQPDRLEVKVWERGAGPTLACGTGACAAVVALATAGLAARAATVCLPGGDLEVDWQDTVYMRGPAREVFRGEWRPDR